MSVAHLNKRSGCQSLQTSVWDVMTSRTSTESAVVVADDRIGLLRDDERTTPPLDDDEGGQQQDAARKILYVSHFLSTWNARLFEFAAVLYLSALYPDTLMPMSVYANVRSLAVVFFASWIGSFIDGEDRLKVIHFSIIWQRVAVAVSCAIFYLLTSYELGTAIQTIVLAVLCILACVEKVCSTINMVSSEKDWIVVIAGDALAEISAKMRTIDLSCKLIAPLCIAYVVAWDLRTSMLVTLTTNAVSVMIELQTSKRVYQSNPGLQARQAPNLESTIDQTFDVRSTIRDAQRYFSHRACLPSFSGALLYCTVLSFGAQMVAFLLAAGYTATNVAIARTASVVGELSAMTLAPRLINKIGAPRAGLWSLNFQAATLTVGTAIFLSQDASQDVRTTALLLATIVSRIGLRGSELSTQIIVQENVAEGGRGSFSSVEAAWQNIFELASYSTTIAFSKPEQFRWPVIVSLFAVVSALCLYTGYVRMHRGHLFHLSCQR